jgi:ribosomal protein L7/L12
MYVPLWILIPAALLLVVLLARALTGGNRREMVDGQRAAGFAPDSAHMAVLAQPDVQRAIAERRFIEAIKLVRERTGLGLKESKQLVERQLPR